MKRTGTMQDESFDCAMMVADFESSRYFWWEYSCIDYTVHSPESTRHGNTEVMEVYLLCTSKKHQTESPASQKGEHENH